MSTSDAHLPPVKAFGTNGMSENLAPVVSAYRALLMLECSRPVKMADVF